MSHRRPRGFTLFELMATIVIVGVLATISVVAYRHVINSSHAAEANEVLASIKQQEDRYSAEMGSYVGVSPLLVTGANVTTGGAAALYPHCVNALTPGPKVGKVAWGATPPTGCLNTANGGSSWAKLNIETHGPVYYGYSLVAGTAGQQPPAVVMGGVSLAWPNPTTVPWFVATAVNDTDGNGVFMTVIVSSFDNEVHIDNEGE